MQFFIGYGPGKMDFSFGEEVRYLFRENFHDHEVFFLSELGLRHNTKENGKKGNFQTQYGLVNESVENEEESLFIRLNFGHDFNFERFDITYLLHDGLSIPGRITHSQYWKGTMLEGSGWIYPETKDMLISRLGKSRLLEGYNQGFNAEAMDLTFKNIRGEGINHAEYFAFLLKNIVEKRRHEDVLRNSVFYFDVQKDWIRQQNGWIVTPTYLDMFSQSDEMPTAERVLMAYTNSGVYNLMQRAKAGDVDEVYKLTANQVMKLLSDAGNIYLDSLNLMPPFLIGIPDKNPLRSEQYPSWSPNLSGNYTQFREKNDGYKGPGSRYWFERFPAEGFDF
ncbi:MAG: hypothetical protein NDI94_05650 [Candidatus Woesearchaeota archaeon]|nr:hypothetical protein [Candidatus Woesearchaeota archaeon]